MATLKVDKDRLPYLEDLALTLENEADFHKRYITIGCSRTARDLITTWKNKTAKARNWDGEDTTTADEREFLRRYFNAKWGVNQAGNALREACDGPGISLFQQPEPVKLKPTTAELETDWLSLPDGTTLITASGVKYTKGATEKHMQTEVKKGYVVGVREYGGWNRWNKEGKSCSYDGIVFKEDAHHLVSYELPAKPTPKQSFDQLWPDGGLVPAKQEPIDYSKLPDGTRLFTKGRGVYIKGDRPPSNVKGFPALLVGKELGCLTNRQVVGYQLKPDGSWDGWNSWYSDGSTDSDDSMYALTGYDATPSGGLMPAIDQPQPTRDDQIDASLYIQPQLTSELIMNATITITTKTLINGSDIANHSNAQLYEIIAAQEKKIAELDAIKNKPKALKKELADRQAGIDALVAHLDSRDDSAAK